MRCHEGIIQGQLSSHDDFSRDGCWTAGCHNFHEERYPDKVFEMGDVMGGVVINLPIDEG